MRNSERCSWQCHDAWQAIIMMHVLGMQVVLDGQPNLICNDSSAVAVLCVAAQQLQCLLVNIQQGNRELMAVGLPHLVKHFLRINLINLAILGLTSITTRRQSMSTAL
eukprot:scaffold835_cov71-Cyclotella_meneghiniana.AAC.2